MKRTHIDTLADNCAKSRRRVRRTLGLKPGIPVGPLQSAWAQEKAALREQKSRMHNAEDLR